MYKLRLIYDLLHCLSFGLAALTLASLLAGPWALLSIMSAGTGVLGTEILLVSEARSMKST